MEDADRKHERRVRYRGTHPRAFTEKYKERDPEKYPDTVARVIAKGSTPAGTHRPIMVAEILVFLRPEPGQTGLDATLGYGGHAAELLQAIGETGRLFAVDADPIELPKTVDRLGRLGFNPPRLTAAHMNFADVDRLLPPAGGFDFVLADLGVSSMQIDDPARGFSFKVDGPLDLRMNPEQGLSAAHRLKSMSAAEIEGMLVENADEPHAERIAQAIVAARKAGRPIGTTSQLSAVIGEALVFLPPSTREEETKKSCQRAFQALRIDVNREYDALYAFLEKLPDVLKPGGRVAILSFHSGEDRLVKKSFQALFRDGVYREIAPGPIRPSFEEQNANPRARSAKLRWAIRA
ncbi:MAG: 16S rRNA (cytosine(1402)-N(4))-methyltransferase RsmH [Candidatus Izemoplasmatales bacterium]